MGRSSEHNPHATGAQKTVNRSVGNNQLIRARLFTQRVADDKVRIEVEPGQYAEVRIDPELNSFWSMDLTGFTQILVDRNVGVRVLIYSSGTGVTSAPRTAEFLGLTRRGDFEFRLLDVGQRLRSTKPNPGDEFTLTMGSFTYRRAAVLHPRQTPYIWRNASATSSQGSSAPRISPRPTHTSAPARASAAVHTPAPTPAPQIIRRPAQTSKSSTKASAAATHAPPMSDVGAAERQAIERLGQRMIRAPSSASSVPAPSADLAREVRALQTQMKTLSQISGEAARAIAALGDQVRQLAEIDARKTELGTANVQEFREAVMTLMEVATRPNSAQAPSADKTGDEE